MIMYLMISRKNLNRMRKLTMEKRAHLSKIEVSQQRRIMRMKRINREKE
jgi:hypothetical protein